MPAIRQISCENNTLSFTDSEGVSYVFTSADIPAGVDTPQSLEDYLNNTWLPAQVGNDLKMVAHVFSVLPLLLTAYATNPDLSIPPNWWGPPQ